MEPYKFIALEIELVPISSKTAIPDPRLVIGVGFITIFLLVAEGYPPSVAITDTYRRAYGDIGSNAAPSMLFDIEKPDRG